MQARAATPRNVPATAAFLEGWRRLLMAPALWWGTWLVVVLVALPSAIVLGGVLSTGFGQAAAQQLPPIARAFTYEMFGSSRAMPVVMIRFLDNDPFNLSMAGAVAAYGVFWVFLSGGILDRFARARAVRGPAFFSACGVYGLRFIRLAILVGPAYWVLFGWLHPFLLGDVYGGWIQNLTDRQAIALRAALEAVFLLTLALVTLVSDFAKVRAVVEDRRSMFAAVGASMRFLRRRPWRSAALYALNALAALVVLRLWFQPSPWPSAPEWVSWLVTGAYLLGRLGARLACMASQIVFFQGELAHAGYTAAPLPMWPESASVEAIERTTSEVVLRKT